MKSKTSLLFWVIVIILLLPILFFPLSPDTSIYLDSGRIIAEGGKIYVDSIDLKQPLIYYIYSLIYLTLGYSEFAVRLFDFFWQMITIISLFYLMKKAFDQKIAFIASIIYAVSYTALNYSQTGQCESFAGLPIVWLIYMMVYKNDKFYHLILTGILIGLVTGFKFTLGLIFIPVIINLILTRHFSKIFIKDFVLISLSMFAGLLVTMLPLLDREIMNGYANVFQYLSYYTSITSFNFDSLKIMLTNTGNFFGDTYSLLLTIGLSAGLFIMLKNLSAKKENVQTSIINISFLMICFLFLTIVWEGKYWDYHFSRLYVPVVILTSIGLSFVIAQLNDLYKTSDNYFKTVLITLVLAAFLFSPFSRWINVVRKEFYYFNNNEKYDSFFSEIVSDKLVPLRQQHKKIAEIVHKNLKEDDFVLVISTGSNAINYFLNTGSVSRFRNSQFIFNPLNIKDWKNYFLDELNRADWIVISTDDSHEKVIGQDFSSFELFQKDVSNFKYFENNFKEFDTVGNFLIFKRK